MVIGDAQQPNDQPALALNIKQAAARLGVHYMTAYRYIRQGQLDAVRHNAEWRIDARALEEFRAARGARPSKLPDDTATPWLHRLGSCLVVGDESAAWRVIDLVLAAGNSPEFCYLEVILPALDTIDDHSASGTSTMYAREIGQVVAMRLIARLGARFRRSGRSRGTVVLGSPPGSSPATVVAVAADLLRLGGYGVIELGDNVSVGAFVAATHQTSRLVAVAITVAGPSDRRRVNELITQLHANTKALPVLIDASRGDTTTAMGQWGNDMVTTMSEVVRTIEALRVRHTSQAAP